MNILFLTPYLPHAPTTGALSRVYNNIQQVRSKHRVVVLSFLSDREKPYVKETELKVDKLYTVQIENRNIGKYHNLLATLFGPPHYISYFMSDKYKKYLTDIVVNERIDLVHIDNFHMAGYAEYIQIPKVIDLIDAETVKIARAAKLAKNIKYKFVAVLQILKIRQYQRNLLPKFDKIMTISEKDASVIRRETGLANIETLEMGVDTEYYYPTGTESDSNVVLFTGLMSYLPNDDAMHFFIDNIFEQISREVPQVKLQIVGRNPSAELIYKVKHNKAIDVTGEVDDIRPFFINSNIYICPLRTGSGVRIKLLEAMAMGKAIVTTSIGAEGIRGRDGVEYLVADRPADFAAKVCLLLENEKMRKDLGAAARKCVEEHYSWNARGDQLLALYDSVINRKG